MKILILNLRKTFRQAIDDNFHWNGEETGLLFPACRLSAFKPWEHLCVEIDP
jgi:hypothetical protein